ncbi:hypothetical protein [Mycolicibacterium austroafricanum]|uniref:hypothetical protein n=1 Tax=Mycolicibacterium austroafricanum TaxID=39687 RepID=UPI001CA344BE|nr:hypothetical protein [Mycolicibacterium austroafricanum]QZT64483.1 hypothetical protein JN085_09260 [Mycolicibacterium austroafricanum]
MRGRSQEVVRGIRTTISGLRGRPSDVIRLRQRLDDAPTAFTDSGLSASVQHVGPLSVLDAAPADHAEAAVRQEVGNAAHLLAATTVAVTIAVDDDLSIDVVDNGPGAFRRLPGNPPEDRRCSPVPSMTGTPLLHNGWITPVLSRR